METTRFKIEKFDVVPRKYGIIGGIDGENLIRLVEKYFKENLIYGRDKLSFEDVNAHLLSSDKLDNEFGLDSKADKQASILVASKKRDKSCRYFKKLGYVKVDCYKLRNKRAVESNKEDVAGANLADESSDDFLYVPDLQKNLISLSILDLKGCRINIESSVIKVSRGALVLLKAISEEEMTQWKLDQVTGVGQQRPKLTQQKG
ncbi:hypothetical protein J1N35_044635 [Gossypium stocksii]|uniref:Uncharacterized protein n=1 Tax=Gossypium stocksii TaxID=47602 RepID=A0A9D3U9W5_9ROSI|nr:hypothetical protein J1N35_044635 [Gossypium stocksii]